MGPVGAAGPSPVEGEGQHPDVLVGGQAEEDAPQAGICLCQLEELQPGCVPLLQTPQDLGTHPHSLQEVDSLWPQKRTMTQMKSVCRAGRVGQRDDRIAETTPMGALPESEC